MYGTFYTKGPVVKIGQWHYLVITFDNSFLNLYVDGVLIILEPKSNIFTIDNHPLVIGRDLAGALEYFHGAMDDFKFWSIPLNNSEINSLFETEAKAGNKTEQPIRESSETFEVNEGESIILHNVLFVQSKVIS